MIAPSIALALLAASPCAELEAGLDRAARSERAERLARFSPLIAIGAAPTCDDAPCVDAALEKLRGLCRALPPATTSVPDRALLERIYAKPELAHAREREPDAARRLLVRIRRWLSWWFEQRTAEDFSRGTRWLVLGIAVVLASAALLRLASRRLDRRTAGALDAAPTLSPPPEHLANAEQTMTTQPRESLRHGLLALLSTLERRRLARPDRVTTNRELLLELPKRGAPLPICEAVREAIDWYDDAYYSLRPIVPAEARSFLERVRDVSRRIEAIP